MASILATLSTLVLLFSLSLALENGDVRLVNGPSPNKGRVEVYYDGVWGTVCDDSWNKQDGDVVCKQLGFESAEYVHFRAHYGEGTGPIWIDQIHCDPVQHQSIIECSHNGWGVHDCRHREDAGLECKRKQPTKPEELPVRLSCPKHSSCGTCKVCPSKKYPDPTDCLPKAAVEGIVEVFYNDAWHPVSSEGWDMSSANVVCGELGYPLALSIPSMDQLWCHWDTDCEGSGSGLFGNEKECTTNEDFRNRLKKSWIKGLDCTGMENKLLDCYFEGFGPTGTPSISSVATVKCGYIPHPDCSSNPNSEKYRTRGSAVPWKGRVEVRVGGEWGTVSDLLWDVRDASVVCRALGYGSAKKATHFSNFGRGVGQVHFANVKCTGSERFLSQCAHVTGTVAQVYGHARDAGVICNVPKREICVALSSRIVQQPETNGYMSNFVEIHDNNRGWGLLCSESIDINIASVICRETSQSFAFRFRKGNHPDFTRTRYTGSMNCTGEEWNLRECIRSLVAVNKCKNEETILQCQTDLPDLVPDLNAFQTSLQYYPYVETWPLYYLRCAHEENCLSSSADGKPFTSSRKLLRFSSQTMNYGTADFVPVLDQSEWIWHSCHNHYHSFEAFIHYDLIDPATGDKVAEGHKASFCLEDSYCDAGGVPRYRCSSGHQGISVNCGDLYNRHLDCQWIDVTDLSPGTYILRQSVNPDKLALESDYRNNVEECTIVYYPGGYVYLTPGSCTLSDH